MARSIGGGHRSPGKRCWGCPNARVMTRCTWVMCCVMTRCCGIMVAQVFATLPKTNRGSSPPENRPKLNCPKRKGSSPFGTNFQGASWLAVSFRESGCFFLFFFLQKLSYDAFLQEVPRVLLRLMLVMKTMISAIESGKKRDKRAAKCNIAIGLH